MTGFTEGLVHSALSNQEQYSYRSGKGMVPSAEWAVVFDDLTQAVATNVPDGWAAAVIDTGATLVAANLAGGAVVVASDGTTEGVGIYMPKCVKLDGKKFYMEVRCKTVAADDTDLMIGLTDATATTNPEDLYTTASADVIAFGVLDGDATVTMLCDKDNSGSSAQLGTIDLANDTWTVLAIEVSGNGTDSTMACKGYVNGKLALTWSTESTIPEDVVLAPFIAARTGGVAGHTITFDYVRVVLQR